MRDPVWTKKRMQADNLLALRREMGQANSGGLRADPLVPDFEYVIFDHESQAFAILFAG